MRRRISVFALATAALSLVTVGAASGADLGRPVYRAPPPVIAPAPVSFWTGFYVGGFVGGAFPNEDVTATDLGSTGGFYAPGTLYNRGSSPWSYGLDDSFIGGGTIGYNWQFPGSPFLVGIEGEVGYMRLTGSAPDPVSPGLDTVSSARVGDWYAVLSGRLGWLPTPDWLVYAKGGAVWTELHADVVDSCTTGACGLGTVNATGSDTTTGWALGGGVEWMFAPRWSAKAEYLFLGIDDSIKTCGPGGANAAGSDFCWGHDFNGVHTVKVGVNYHF